MFVKQKQKLTISGARHVDLNAAYLRDGEFDGHPLYRAAVLLRNYPHQ